MKRPAGLRAAAIYGGSFDPPHEGHRQVIEAILQSLPVARLFVVPANLSPFKQAHGAPGPLRLAWLKRIVPDDPRIVVSDIEIERAGPSYTIDTVERLGRGFDPVYLVIGADNLPGLQKWHDFERLDRMVEWVVATRDEKPIPSGFRRLDVAHPASSSRWRERFEPAWIPEAIRDEVMAFYHHATDDQQEG
jgi:nicotinate-nucleotide adenylyltransferase